MLTAVLKNYCVIYYCRHTFVPYAPFATGNKHAANNVPCVFKDASVISYVLVPIAADRPMHQSIPPYLE